MRKQINRMIAVLFFVMALLLLVFSDWRVSWVWIGVAVAGMVLHIWWSVEAGYRERRDHADTSDDGQQVLTELVLLDEADHRIGSWEIYGKNGLVIGRDVGENQVSINLENTVYAGMIDIEHAVLNYSGDSWYIEDISEKNGVSIQKRDGKKYKLSYGKPCRLEAGDIICIALTRLQIL